mmetsp:Transcript_137/g.174  ORF Transcript_137/g.174 Transcript_137/m.174 type:complete len:270 (-) Transcript_137:146-955(-)|eukprot:CAMPEP_0205824508 /NCGR_PEP_ID=MMETSP0206-20130828/21349_1 /ASSEMBLY_ACC=CAM_ASM_000279 /TAXON_ID=36767 /ORGANISM="Euplotes focardii, Strain TN1" /LENGTH=269 /DNA_ID=CAMNT_0053122717 /DNA_START=44 /DNA_END=853 /DNA_ORIENTATION=-
MAEEKGLGEILPNEDEAAVHAWSPTLDAGSFNLRIGPNYKKHGRKAPSGPSLYEVFACKMVTVKKKHRNITKLLPRPQVPEVANPCLPLPPLLVVNMMVPNYGPKLMGDKDDGIGAQIVMYARMAPQTMEFLKGTAKACPPAMHLLARYMKGRAGVMKGIGRLENPKSLGLSSPIMKLVTKYNSKPFLVFKAAKNFVGAGYFEFGMDVYNFSFMSRKALWSMKKDIANMVLDLAFVVQGDADDELPEQLLLGATLKRLVLERFPPMPGV